MGRSAVEAHAAAIVERDARREALADIITAADEICIAAGELCRATSGFASRDEGVEADDVEAAWRFLDRLRNMLQVVEGGVCYLAPEATPRRLNLLNDDATHVELIELDDEPPPTQRMVQPFEVVETGLSTIEDDEVSQ
jgi:hypothetical protein